jgi:hypothetical protein
LHQHNDGFGALQGHVAIDTIFIDGSAHRGGKFTYISMGAARMAAYTTLGEQSSFARLIGMGIVAGTAGHGFTHPKAFAGFQQSELVAVHIDVGRVTRSSIQGKIVSEGIACSKLERGF